MQNAELKIETCRSPQFSILHSLFFPCPLIRRSATPSPPLFGGGEGTSWPVPQIFTTVPRDSITPRQHLRISPRPSSPRAEGRAFPRGRSDRWGHLRGPRRWLA